jgi:choline dehydrogenase-like flavoprotein
VTLRGFADARGTTSLDADVVVVGSGPGGSAISRVLSEAGARVVVLEEGPPTPRFKPNYLHTQRYHMQEGGMMVARAGATHAMPIAAGRGVGGGSLVNSAICFRTPARVLDGWAALLGGDDRFSRANLDPVYAEMEALLGVGATDDETSGENNRIIKRGAEKLGFPGGMAPRNAPGCVGCSLCNMGCPSGGKASVDRVLVPIAREHGAVVQADVKVDEILIDGGRAVGVAGNVHDTDTQEIVGRITVRAGKVIVCAGGVGTPRLLHHTGVAARLGPAVGRGMHVHPGNAVLGLCDYDVHMWKGATQGAYFEDPELPGVLPHTFNAPPGVVLVLLGGVGQDAKENLPLLRRLCGSVVMVSDTGEGTVGARADGRADLAYDFAPQDVERIKRGMVSTARVLLAGGAKKITGMVHGVGWHEDVDTFAKALQTRTIDDFGLYASHPMASCRMGADPESSVVGPNGESHGLPGLYIADSSVFPTSLGVNPQLTTMVLATVIGRRLAS